MIVLRNRWLQLSILTGFLGFIGINALRLKYRVIDFDIWWHLKVGNWIVEHTALPHTGILSRTAANHPWVAYGWGHEVLLSCFYAWFGVIGVGVFGTLLTMGVAYSVYWMARRTSGRFWLAILLAVAARSAFLFSGLPRPVFFSMSADFPVNAINFLRRQNFSGPLYNNLNWGVFLMWYLPELPVAVDGRNDLYGDDMDKIFYESQSAFPSYASDPYLNESGLVIILDSTLPLAKILTIDSRFQMVYHDDIATVFLRRPTGMSALTENHAPGK